MKNFKIATDNPLCTKIYYSNIWKRSDFSHFPTFQHCHPGLQNNHKDNELVNFQQWRNGQLWTHLDIYLFWRIKYQKEKHVFSKYLVIVFPTERRTTILLEKQEVKQVDQTFWLCIGFVKQSFYLIPGLFCECRILQPTLLLSQIYSWFWLFISLKEKKKIQTFILRSYSAVICIIYFIYRLLSILQSIISNWWKFFLWMK